MSKSKTQIWPYQGWSHVSSLSLADAVHPEGTPWILPRLDPGTGPLFTLFVAFLFGIGPKFVELLPAIAVGNLVLVLLYSLILGGDKKPIWLQAVVWVGAAAAKFGALYLLMVKLLVPGLVSAGTVAAAAGEKLSAQFGILQMVTALIGGAVALLIVPLLRKALHKGG